MEQNKSLVFFSFDIEADGRAPGLSSMLAFGAVALRASDGKVLRYWNVNLMPLPGAVPDPDTMRWWKTQPDAWRLLQIDRQDPGTAIEKLAREIEKLQDEYEVVPVAWPAAFDWAWLNYYMWRFAGRNPLGYSCQCIGSYAWAAGGRSKPRDHNALIEEAKCRVPSNIVKHVPGDDALEQAFILFAIWLETARQDLVPAASHPPQADGHDGEHAKDHDR